MQPRFRMFAGPNGSGKTFLFNSLKSQSFIHTEIYVNADRIEQKLAASLQFNFNAYRVKVTDDDFKTHIRQSGILKKIRNKSFIEKLEIKSGILRLNIRRNELSSYIASFVSTYLAEKLLETNQSFCYETVLSHPSKIDFLKSAVKAGYKTYLYFIFTDNWRLNVERVKLRVKRGGHDVDDKKIELRYFRSLKLFKAAAQSAHNTFLIDNSNDFELMAKLKNGKTIFIADNYPQWLRKYFNPKN